ncbi:biotin--[acetyl-CoA-carboxylase] ligase [Lactobacillus helveticus]|uniref:biotin--[acetyl-CoA-carboxylase] ligase n=1 Tax=Lactobacillus helveticus TaxID=1587 RepID=UPI001562C004|nr:biotin--[acetyl-CoA-carboxylase] ligase [Lactobacillus helveticus]NRN77068.1 Bifunctional ligase/repressor BirA [Lactobacillus helveticus]NRO10889.1 Bifunctional ligase/repressor BirA [Lactobacillus helveticus]NRO66901.1 Bifunctional ligase/repressor BirA [Lactobacillus helveticus]
MADHQSQILRALLELDNRYISGNELAWHFNISRPAVYNNIQKLKQKGHLIETKKGLGYSYQKSKCFDAQVIDHYRVTTYPVRTHVFDRLTSTNDYAKQYGTEKTVYKPQIFVTDTQTKGRGRLGRRFYSPAKTGIYMSLLIPIQTRQTLHSGLITTGTAVCVVRSLQPFFPQVDFRVKWVNDILAHDKKCGGILTETTASLEDGSHENVIVGIGLNVDSDDFPDPIKHKAGAIVAHSQIDRNKIVAKIIDNFFYMYQTYQTGNFLSEYAQLSDILGRKIRVEMGSRVYLGIADHFDNEGALVMNTDSGQLTVSSGEVTKVYLPENGYTG